MTFKKQLCKSDMNSNNLEKFQEQHKGAKTDTALKYAKVGYPKLLLELLSSFIVLR
jgi:hypothetical protein